MQQTKKSIAYDVLAGCVLLISSPFFLLWQPSFEYGYFSIPFLNGVFVFSLWTFLPACLALGLFAWSVMKTIRS